VINPGPRTEKKRRTKFFFEDGGRFWGTARNVELNSHRGWKQVLVFHAGADEQSDHVSLVRSCQIDHYRTATNGPCVRRGNTSEADLIS
jgi:hypothetical protein